MHIEIKTKFSLDDEVYCWYQMHKIVKATIREICIKYSSRHEFYELNPIYYGLEISDGDIQVFRHENVKEKFLFKTKEEAEATMNRSLEESAKKG